MKHVLLFVIAIACANLSLADHHPKTAQFDARQHYLLDGIDCKKVKDGVGSFLAVADDLLGEIKQQGKEKNKKWQDKKWREASFFSNLAANYSTVYQVWCKNSN